MFKISSKASITLSLIFSAGFFVLLAFGAAVMPSVVEYFLDFFQITRMENQLCGSFLILSIAYSILAVALLADILLFLLLLRIRSNLIFTDASVTLIRGVSWCCFLLGILLGGLVYYFPIILIAAFAAVFLGLCLRVVKNVMEEATRIKTENDFTV